MEQLADNNTRIWFDETLLKEDASHCFDVEFWQQKNAVLGSATGRGTTWFVQTQTVPAALRHYRRGGLFGKLVADSYLFTGWENTRAAQEFNLLHYIKEQGIAVPRPLAARAIRDGMTYRADLLVEKVDGAKDLVDILMQSPLSAEKYQEIGALVKKLHDAGVCHTDLNIHNILLDDKGEFWLIDFDNCGRRKGDSWKAANLSRLLRSFRKELGKRAINWQESDWTELLKGYEG
ncbi:3-deoxy-D-manno-octulosonic acid kinase [Enterovibrio sp. ZSDZ35]|uniref:3-deoxy-D-manno-octulosonic acid kinase n=1 Tax=Enterovibrio qingdaonensis TaxID=2899818 RepID=A0ABT5QN78_9GAMM|nr:3-deoxy-D-manno-octulosonic acid kinase [Enterovibrio sp. ZSDZ35]MDD1782054.1 3-deoxy-D-manno-octulosonic acid kinase [Enterovibrio sp. ZSDZ35]